MNTVKSIKISLFALAILFFCGDGNVVAAQDGSGKATTTTTTSTTNPKSKTTKVVPKTTKPKATKGKKTPDPPVGDWEINNLIGYWEGFYNEGSSVLEIERVDGDNFYGHFTKGDFQVAFTGVIDRKARTVTWTETEVLQKPSDGRGWILGVNTGTLKYGGFDMKGSGKDAAGNVYTWSYVQNLLK